MADAALTEERVKKAEAFLQETVFRSRDAQANVEVFEPQIGNAAGKADEGACGLGKKAVVVLDLSPRGHELFAELWPNGLAPAAIESVREAMADWIRRQDALDRKRNHFLKDFRRTHGFDRKQYDAEQQTAFRAGLDAVNAAESAERRDAASAVLRSA